VKSPWVPCLTASLFFFYTSIEMNMYNAFSSDFLNVFSMTAAKLGLLSSLMLYATIIFLYPAGWLLDRFSIRQSILIALSASFILMFLFSWAQNVWEARIINFLLGIAASFSFLGPMKLASHWFRLKKLPYVTGLIITIGMLGAVCAQTPLVILTAHVGWRLSMQLIAGLGIIITLIISIFVKDYPTQPIENPVSNSLLPVEKYAIFRNRWNWFGGLYNSLLNLPMTLLGAEWSILYLTQVHHLSTIQASYISSILFVGMIIGSPILGWLVTHTKRHSYNLMKICCLLGLLDILVIMFIPHLYFTSLVFLFLTLGFLSGIQSLGFSLVVENNPPQSVASGLSFAAIFVMAGGALLQPTFGWILDHFNNSSIKNAIPEYTSMGYLMAFLIIPIAFIAAYMMMLYMRIKTSTTNHTI